MGREAAPGQKASLAQSRGWGASDHGPWGRPQNPLGRLGMGRSAQGASRPWPTPPSGASVHSQPRVARAVIHLAGLSHNVIPCLTCSPCAGKTAGNRRSHGAPRHVPERPCTSQPTKRGQWPRRGGSSSASPVLYQYFVPPSGLPSSGPEPGAPPLWESPATPVPPGHGRLNSLTASHARRGGPGRSGCCCATAGEAPARLAAGNKLRAMEWRVQACPCGTAQPPC